MIFPEDALAAGRDYIIVQNGVRYGYQENWRRDVKEPDLSAQVDAITVRQMIIKQYQMKLFGSRATQTFVVAMFGHHLPAFKCRLNQGARIGIVINTQNTFF